VNELGVERGQHDGRRRRHARWSGWGRRGEALHGGIIEARVARLPVKYEVIKKFLECIKIIPGMIYNSPRQLCRNTQEIKCSPQIHKECLRLFQRLTI